MLQLHKALMLSAFLAFSVLPLQAEEVPKPDKENFHLFLLAGQSNMAGRGKVAEQDKKIHPRVLALSKDGTWVPAVDPIHFDKSSAGVGLGKSFAIQLAEADENVVIGLIPVAAGGSPISTWQPKGYHGQTKSHPYDDAIARAEVAMKDGTLKGILWHQGESDSSAALAPKYQTALAELIARFRKDLDSEQVPFIIGQLGQFEERPWDEHRQAVDNAHQALAKKLANVGFVSSQDLTCKTDKIHFDAASLREFGKRYATVYKSMVKED